jgi:hypothetical protein
MALYLDFACLVTFSLLSYVISAFIYKRIRGTHPRVWEELGFPKGTAYPGARYEREQARSQIRLLRFVWSDNHKGLHDAKLNRLVVAFTLNGTLVLLCLLIGAALVFQQK